MEEAFISILLTDPDVSAIAGGRIYWLKRTQGSGWPAVRLQVVSRVGDYTTSEPTTLSQARIQIDCFAESYDEVRRLARAIVDRLDGMREEYSGTFFHGGFMEGERDGYEDEAKVFRVSIDFLVWTEKVG